ncbi:DUF3348 family protein [Aquabacterium sp. CECT 9606]|uniref:DUF3348 family protein n=1 Tax=Aquabacterium sp. CECT 9606 TaxID=2845822 RepID=UPI001EF9BD97|nr:DUF3348 family protein [Aquabacterium sp. CECT 9606]CAH0351126.1 hypothetical protein AQB9606_01937 [Aquabacterium sp. CECT 9606]
MHLRRNFSSSRLVRLLSDAASVDVDASRQDVAEKLGLWLGTLDTLQLHAAHQSIKAFAQETPAHARAATSHPLEEDVQRVRAALVQGITANGAAQAIDADAGYAPYRQRYLEQQRHIESKIASLRSHVRQILSRASPRLKQLAYLDTVMEQVIGGREQRLMGTVPVLLEKRYEQLRRAQDDGWQDTFRQAWQEVLLAEMAVRLQPVVGLMEAFSNEVKKSP